MRVKCVRLKIHNFMSFEDAELKFPEKGVIFVEGENRDEGGSNGAGKSAIFDSLIWVLVGKVLRDTSERGGGYIRRGSTECSVLLEIVKDGVAHSILRTRNGSMRVFLDGSEVTDEQICDFVGVDMTGIVNSVIFGQNITDRFVLLQDSEKKEILSKILGYDIFIKASELAKEKSKKIQSEVLRIENEIDKCKEIEREREESAVNNSRQYEALEKEKKKIEEFSKSKREEIGERLKDINKKIKELEDRKIEIGNLVIDLNKDVEECRRIAAEVRGKEASACSVLESVKEEKALLEKKLEELVKQDKCPLCRRKFDENSRRETKDSYNETIKEKEEKIKELEIKIKTYNANDKEDEYTKKTRELEKHREDLRNIEAEIYKHRTMAISLENEATKTLADASVLEVRMEEIKKKINEDIMRITEVKEKIKTFESDKESLLEEKVLYDFWETGFGKTGIISFLLVPDVEFLDSRVNTYLSQFSKNIRVNISTKTELKSNKVKDSLSIKVNNVFGGDNYKLSSGGERKRIDIAMILGLRDLVRSRYGNSLGLFVADEIFDSVDAQGIEVICEKLSELDDLVFVLSHSDDLKRYFPVSIKVVKENGISRIENN